ncbi:MAG: sulfotransferase family 2 domain-containing protein [Phycisphaeraceae bacterium]|nr:sulfotransferase family 2 domain-containing protein [Phycisphaeraceae bacterium]
MPHPLLIHLHLPKNAGTTFSRMLKLRLLLSPPWRVFRHQVTLGYYFVPGLDPRVQRINDLPEAKRKKVRFFEAHCGWGIHERLPGPSAYLTVIREPIDRTLSVYFFRKQQGKLPQETRLEDWISASPDQTVWHVDNGQVRYLAGEHGRILDVPIGEVTREHLETAKARLSEMFFVGIMERFDESIVLFRRAMGWKKASYGRSNVTKKRKKKDEIDTAQRELIARHNVLDTELYAFACELFQQRITAAGPGFAEEVVRFKAKNAAHNRRLGWLYELLPAIRSKLQKLRLIGR